MKKTIAFILSLPLLLLFSCTASLFPDLQNDLKDLDAAPYSTHISIEKARKTVQDALDAMALQTKAGVGRTITEGYLMDRSRMTKAAAEAPGDTIPPYYVFNFADDQGYALASVDSRMSPILCIIDQGHFSPDSALTNPGQIALLSRIETDYRMALGLPIEGPDGEIVEVQQYATDLNIPLELTDVEGGMPDPYVPEEPGSYPMMYYYGPLLATKWHQDYPFNDLMINGDGVICPTGCVNTALAQILKYHGTPVSVGGYYVDWSLIATTIASSSDPGCAILQNYHLRAALALNANMTPTETGILSESVPAYLHSIGYAAGSLRNIQFNQMDADMHANRPVYGRGKALRNVAYVLGIPVVTSYDKGHAWVYDGMLRYVHVYYTSQYSVSTEVLYLPHCALGWKNGKANGYYYWGDVNTNPSSIPFPTSIDPNQVGFPDMDNEGVPGWYQYNMQMITGIYPTNPDTI